jgi:DNA-binding NarL/FixJ family response regulator
MDTQRSRTIKVALVDDHPLLLRGVRGLLEGEDDLVIVGEATSGRQALQLISVECADVAVIDVALPGMHGIDVTRRLVAQRSSTRVIILSAYEERIYVQQALAAGAKGYVLKRSLGDTLIQGIRGVYEGGLYLDPGIAGLIVPTRPRGDDFHMQALTNREREVIRLIARGLTIKEAATKLGITSKSVETYKMRASGKLNLYNRAKIVQYAMLQGWFDQISI